MNQDISSDKSYVGMLHDVCPICTKESNTQLLLDRRLRNTLERDNYRLGDICKDCKAILATDRIALVEISNPPPVGKSRVDPGEANRTGTVMWLRRHVFQQLFGETPSTEFVFVDPDVVVKLKALYEESCKEEVPEISSAKDIPEEDSSEETSDESSSEDLGTENQ